MMVQVPYHRYYKEYQRKYEALYHALRTSILCGQLEYGTKLPSTREIAKMYHLSRSVASTVYETLTAEGYLAAHVGKGTFVALHQPQGDHQRTQAAPTRMEISPSSSVSRWAERLDSVILGRRRDAVDVSSVLYDFRVPRTDARLFPQEEWNRHLRQTIRENGADGLGAMAPEGHPALRAAIATHLRRTRAIVAEADDVVIVNGSMQAIAILVQILVNEGDPVVMEDPGYRGVHEAVQACGGRLLYGVVDEQGVRVEDWPSRLAFVTPSRQFPTGAVMTMDRRQKLLMWAQEHRAIIIEDDYDSEFRYAGRPLEPLKAMDGEDRVVYVGTFSKILGDDVRLGYVVLPKWLRDSFVHAKFLFEPQSPTLLIQRTLASFIYAGGLDRHLRRLKRNYAQRYDLCMDRLIRDFSEWFQPVATDSGLHVFAWWKDTEETLALFLARGREGSVHVPSARPYMRERIRPAVLFGFSTLTLPEIEKALCVLREVLQDVAL